LNDGVAKSRGREVSGRDRETARPRDPVTTYELLVVGCSLGGMQALSAIFEALPEEFCVPIVVAQHRHKASNEGLPAFFRRHTALRVADAEDKERLEPGHVYLAPADYHLLVAAGELHLSVDDAVRHSRPSIDVLFESAADAYGEHLIGLVLTGANADGAHGAQRIKQRGGLVVVQDPATADARVMPDSVIAAVQVDRILPLEGIASYLADVCRLPVRRP